MKAFIPVLLAGSIFAGCGPNPQSIPWVPFTIANPLGQGNGPAGNGATAGDGMVFAFTSEANNLVAGDTNGVSDLFVRDNTGVSTTRILAGVSGQPFISADGRFVSVPNDATIYDRQTSTLLDLGVVASGSEGTAWVSSSGTEAAFGIGGSIINPSAISCWIRAFPAGAATRCNPNASVPTGLLAASADLSRLIVRIVPFNQQPQLAVIDRVAGTVTPVAGALTPFSTIALSPNGRYLAYPVFSSVSSPFPSTIWVRDLQLGTTAVFTPPVAPDAMTQPAAVADDGNSVLAQSIATNLVPGDTNGVLDVFRLNLSTGSAVRISATQSGAQLLQESYTVTHPSAANSSFTGAVLCGKPDLSSADSNGLTDCTLVPI